MTTITKNAISMLVLDICEQVHSQYGPGLLKSVYEDILCYELDKRNVKFVRQCPIDLIHDGVLMNVGFKADIVVEDDVLVELSDAAKLEEIDIRSVKTYVKLAGIREGLLVNFNEPVFKDGIRSVINDPEK